MRTTTGRKTAHRRLGRHLSLRLEPLEQRLALSSPASLLSTVNPTDNAPMSGSLAIVSASPADSTVLSSSPTSLRITFDRPLSSFSLTSTDFQLVRAAGNGSTTPVLGSGFPFEESLDPDGYQIDLGLNTPLASGRYQVLLSPSAQLRGLDGSMLATAGSSPIAVDDFSIGTTRSGLGSATDLQTLGSSEIVVPGQLNLAADPGSVQYYKFEVAPGHHWLVGLQVSGVGVAATMDASLSLFDASGRRISTANQGLSGNPGDPYLFAGLDAGTYYVGVAASRNVPGASGTYDSTVPASSTDLGGPFQLDAVADIADQPSQVLGLRLDHADPLSTAPTGLTLEFSGGLAPASFSPTGASPLVLVGPWGTTWSLTPTHYDPADGQLSLAFDRPLAPGTYSVELAKPDSLLDLAGWTPVAAGLSSGTLGHFVVTPSNQAAGDLGVVLPGLGASGLGSTLKVTPGVPTTESFVIVEPGVYAFNLASPDGGARFSIADGSGNPLPVPTGPGHASFLSAGSYQVILTTTGAQSTPASFSISQRLAERSSLLDTGVAQSPALGLRLVTPQANFGQDSSTSTAPTSSAATPVGVVSSGTSGPAAGASPATPSGSAGAGRSAAGPAAGVALSLTAPGGSGIAGLLLGAGPVGRPSSTSNSVGVVGLTGSGLAAVASNSEGLSIGLIVAQAPEPDATGPLSEAVAGATLESGLLARSAEGRREDDSSLADLGRIGQLLADALERLAPSPATAPTAAEAGPDLAVAAPPTAVEPGEADQPVAASMAPPLALGVVVGVIVIGSRRMSLKKKTAPAMPREAAGLDTIIRGPHRRRAGVLAR